MRLEEFGADRLTTCLRVLRQNSPRKHRRRILAATDDYSGAGVLPSDDRTLLVLRVPTTILGLLQAPIIY